MKEGRRQRDDPHARAPVNLTMEEIQVLKDCRVNSIYYRGLPLGVLSVFVARGAVRSGYFPVLKRWSTAFSVGMFGLGFLSGVASYRETCLKKIMALENSTLKDHYLQFLKEHNLSSQSSEFAEIEEERSTTTSKIPVTPQNDVNASVVNRTRGQKDWDDIRQQARQIPKLGDRGISYEELKRRKQINENIHKNTESTDTTENMPKVDFESFTTPSYVEEKSSFALNFTRDDDPKSLSYSSDDYSKQEENAKTKRSSRRKQGTVRKNIYGDDME